MNQVTVAGINQTLIHYKRLLNAGPGDEDISALYRLKKAMFDKDRA